MKIRGKIVLVTGGAHGIGRALCVRFNAEGASRIYVADVDMDAANETARLVDGVAVSLDVADEKNCREVVERIVNDEGRLDFIASNAGIGGEEGSLEVSNEVWRAIHEINVMSHLYLARAAFPSMLAGGGGAFMITASAAGLLTHPTATPYAVTKRAAVAMAESLSIEFGPEIYVSCLCPQGVRTRLIETPEGEPENFLLADAISVEECADAVVASLAEDRFMILPHPEVEQYMVAKASDYERWIHGLRKLRRAVTAPKTAS